MQCHVYCSVDIVEEIDKLYDEEIDIYTTQHSQGQKHATLESVRT